MKYTLYATATTLNSAGVTFVTNSSTMKFEIQLGSWNFVQPTNTLRLHMTVDVLPAITSDSMVQLGQITQFTLHSSNVLTTTINVIGYGVADGNNTAVAATLDASSNPADLVMDFPHFTSTFIYDPDFSVTVQGSTADGDGSTNLLPLLALIALVFVPGVLLLITVIIIAVVLFRKWRQNYSNPSDNYAVEL